MLSREQAIKLAIIEFMKDVFTCQRHYRANIRNGDVLKFNTYMAILYMNRRYGLAPLKGDRARVGRLISSIVQKLANEGYIDYSRKRASGVHHVTRYYIKPKKEREKIIEFLNELAKSL